MKNEGNLGLFLYKLFLKDLLLKYKKKVLLAYIVINRILKIHLLPLRLRPGEKTEFCEAFSQV